jgi:hypothetical protein
MVVADEGRLAVGASTCRGADCYRGNRVDVPDNRQDLNTRLS